MGKKVKQTKQDKNAEAAAEEEKVLEESDIYESDLVKLKKENAKLMSLAVKSASTQVK